MQSQGGLLGDSGDALIHRLEKRGYIRKGEGQELEVGDRA